MFSITQSGFTLQNKAIFLKIYLKDDVVITDELVRLFEENMQLGAAEVTYSGTLIMYSDIIVKVLYENGYKDGLLENAIKFFYHN